MKTIPIKQNKRSCNGCTKCCEGWLWGSANGYDFWPGRPCHFLSEGKCAIYGKHPQDPCKSYRCQWLANENIPGWMKPSEVNAILTVRRWGNLEYLDITEAGEKLRSEVLSWAVMHCLSNNINLRYTLNGGSNKIGSKEFLVANLNIEPPKEIASGTV